MTSDSEMPAFIERNRPSLGTIIQSLSDCLDMVASVVRVYHYNIQNSETSMPSIFPALIPVLKRMVSFSSLGWYMLETNGLGFQLEIVEPDTMMDCLRSEVEQHMEEGTFSWALYHNQPVLVPSKTIGKMLLMHVLSTRTRVLGMFVGTIEDENTYISPEIETLLSILMLISASITENMGLYKEVKEANQNLERIVQERTEELLRKTEESEAANIAKSEFLATMSHEIRSPMNGVMGICELMMETQLSDEQRDYTESIYTSSKVLLNVINDILDFSRIEAGKMILDEVLFNPRRSLEDILNILGGKANDKKVDLFYQVAADVPNELLADDGKLHQILINLVDNGLKFTHSGFVSVELSLSEPIIEGSDSIDLLFTVKDSGIGIPQNKLQNIFESFSQADQSITRQYGGSGLGLAINSRLVKMMGGRIWVESTENKGSSFHFTIQARLSSQQRAMDCEMPRNAFLGKRILILDDNPQVLNMLAELCKYWGMIPKVYTSIFDTITSLQQNHAYDLILLDGEMPVLNGAELVLEIQKLRPLEELPLILMGSLGNLVENSLFKNPRQYRLLDESICEFINKPISHYKLFKIFHDILTGQQKIFQKYKPRPKLDYQLAARLPLRILLAEDNRINQKLATKLLAKMGYHCDVAQNGLEALELVKQKPYDLIFMDVQMPNMDGLEATRQILNGKLVHKKPVIIAMTAFALKDDMQKCLEAGMSDYISKPIYIEEVQTKLKHWGEFVNNVHPPSGPEQISTTSELSEDNNLESLPLLDLEVLLERIDHDIETTLELLDLFLTEADATMATLTQEAIQSSDMKTIAYNAHKLKGLTRDIGGEQLAHLALQLELQGKEGSIPEPELLCNELQKAYQRLKQEVLRWQAENAS